MIKNIVTDEILDKYFELASKAITMAKSAPKTKGQEDLAEEFLGMAISYFEDAKYFREKGDLVKSYGCLNYSHGWLDSGARLKLFIVNDDHLFAIDKA